MKSSPVPCYVCFKPTAPPEAGETPLCATCKAEMERIGYEKTEPGQP